MTAAEKLVGLTGAVYAIRREQVGMRLDLTTLMDHFGLPKASSEQIDEFLDEE